MSLAATRACVGAAIAVLATACVKHLPPRPPPDAIAPKIDTSSPPPEGAGRLVVDVVDGSTPIQIVQMAPQEVADAQGRRRVTFVETPHLLCNGTPCVSDPQRGNVLLGFPVIGAPSRLEIELVHVGDQPSVYRRSLSEYHTTRKGAAYVLGIIGTALGGASATTGIVLLPIGLADKNEGLTAAGGITLGVGAILLAAGIWAIRSEADTYRPGSAAHFPLGR